MRGGAGSGAVRVCLRAEARTNGWAWVGAVALLAGLLGASAAMAAGARRTSSVVDRAVVAQRSPDIYMVPGFSENGELLDFDTIAALPEVAEAFRIPLLDGAVDGEPRSIAAVPASFVEDGRTNVVDGSLADLAVDDAIVNFLAHDAWGVGVGDEVTVDLDQNVSATFEIRAVVASVGDLGGDAEPAMFVTEAFWQEHEDELTTVDLLTFRLARGPADVPTFTASLAEISGGAPVFFVEARPVADQARRSFDLLANALWILAAFLAVTAILIGTQLLLQLVHAQAADRTVLRALGMTSKEIVLVSFARCVALVTVGAAVGAALAAMVSPAFPFGRARLVEPEVGIAVDLTVLAGGTAAAGLVIVLACAVALFLGTSGRRADDAPVPTSGVGRLLRRGLPNASATIGSSFALDAGRGSRSVPLRSSFATAVLGVAAFVIALTVGASLDHLRTTPGLYGWNWDVTIAGEGDIDADLARGVPGIAGVATGVSGEGGTLLLADRQVAATAMDFASGIAPPLLEGELPNAPDEMAVGARTLRNAGLRLGDVVTTSFTGIDDQASFRIVGTVVLPFSGDTTSLGEGALLTTGGAERLYRDIPADTAFVRFEPGVDRAATIAALADAFPDDEVEESRQPDTVLDFGRVSGLPLLAAGIVGVLAAGTIAHVLLRSIRSRRRDLAVVKSLGARRSQVRAILAWQATIIMAAALLVGIPAGIICGRWLWILLARSYGFVAVPVLAPATVVAVALGGIALGNVVAILPARRAARTKPASILRAD